MKEIVPSPPPIVRNDHQAIQELFHRHVVPTYARFDLVLSHGQGSYLWDVRGQRYLDLGGGIAVCCLGHANAEITEALVQQSQKLVHVSNLYYQEPQGRLAQRIVKHLAPGKVFFCNSGAEADEGLFKLARKFGHDEGRYEILTATNSFHGRTLAGISATGQEKVKKGFEPMVAGFRHVPYNDLQAMREAISPSTAAILIEGIQGEGGILPASPEYLLGLRQLCDEKNLLLLMDCVQCGHFRTGRFQSFQRILEVGPASSLSRSAGILPEPAGIGTSADTTARLEARPTDDRLEACPMFLPDAISMAKSLGGGFPIGAFWVRDKHADLLGAGTHGTTFGGTPLACAVALRIFNVIERDGLADNARSQGEFLLAELTRLQQKFPRLIQSVRGLGLIIGVSLAADIPAFAGSDKSSATQLIHRLQAAGLLLIPSGTHVLRFLPPLNLRRAEAEEGIAIFERVLAAL